jgi:hypothetical protein
VSSLLGAGESSLRLIPIAVIGEQQPEPQGAEAIFALIGAAVSRFGSG